MKPVAAGRTSWLHRLNYTPLRDVVRGRLSARLDVAAIIAAAGLPIELGGIVRTVASRTRLTRLEKADVATELAAHFQDGLDAGVGAEELAATFGNARQAAHLIRRAKLRGRPIYWKVARAIKRAIQLVLALALLVYAIQAVRLYSHAPNVARNYVAEWNAVPLAVPEAERAWPLYRAAFLAETKPCPDFAPGDRTPRGPRWNEVVDYVAENTAATDGYRHAASLPHIGVILTTVPDTEVEERLGWRVPPPGDEPKDTGIPWFIAVQTRQLPVLREGYRLLTLDARVAGQAGNADLALGDLGAALNSVNHCFQMRMLIGDLTALTVAGATTKMIGGLLHDQPGLFSDAQLGDLSHRLAALGGEGNLQIDFTSEAACFEDLLQRFYTDDGHGDGLPSADVFQLAGNVGGPGALTWSIGGLAGKIVAPAFSAVIAGRKELETKYRELHSQAEEEARVPLWAREQSAVDQEIVRLSASPISKLRYLPAVLLFPSYSRASAQTEYVRQTRDATLVAIALELYRRHAGHWPAALEELAPHYLPQVPPDRYDGQPIKYRLVDGEPLLYSIGVNRVDDGGCLPKARQPNEKLDVRNHRAYDWRPADEAELCDGDWLLWPPVE